ncbi:MAG: diguanylate cyclase [Desulfobacteraceae bacterium]|nr:diguanylate cyclase [Desulfobacteraceae bacterium]
MDDREEMKTVLLIDDTPENIQLLVETLKDEYKIMVATSGSEAIDMLKTEENLPDLILLDILMPDIDGYDVCKWLKNNDRTRSIPVIFVTALAEIMDETKGIKLGAVDYITKPFYPPIIKARVQAHINLKMKSDMLEQFVSLDALTNIPNRRKFDEVIVSEWRRAQRYDSPLSVIMINVDQFKQYNDNYGHGPGDLCLQSVARAIQSRVRRAYDFLARYGGKEFIAILPDVDVQGAQKVGISIIKAVENLHIPHELSKASDHVTVSLGIATMHPANEAESYSKIIEGADQLLEQAKKAGRNRFCIRNFDED